MAARRADRNDARASSPPGSRNAGRVAQNTAAADIMLTAAADLMLTAADLARIAEIAPDGGLGGRLS